MALLDNIKEEFSLIVTQDEIDLLNNRYLDTNMIQEYINQLNITKMSLEAKIVLLEKETELYKKFLSSIVRGLNKTLEEKRLELIANDKNNNVYFSTGKATSDTLNSSAITITSFDYQFLPSGYPGTTESSNGFAIKPYDISYFYTDIDGTRVNNPDPELPEPYPLTPSIRGVPEIPAVEYNNQTYDYPGPLLDISSRELFSVGGEIYYYKPFTVTLETPPNNSSYFISKRVVEYSILSDPSFTVFLEKAIEEYLRFERMLNDYEDSTIGSYVDLLGVYTSIEDLDIELSKIIERNMSISEFMELT